MEVLTTPIEGLLVLNSKIIEDNRGYFFESWNRRLFSEYGLDFDFVQDNQSLSKKGVLRGLHFQNPPFAQGKLVRVVKGSVMDVAVDIRKESKTYGKHLSILLSERNKKVFWIPPGFAHGFVALENDTIFNYKCTNFFNKDAENALLWNDSVLNIDWSIEAPLVSEKDQQASNFKDFKSQF
jgi:dTDP-4-dehydrorhamnose 3,5-epimerase